MYQKNFLCADGEARHGTSDCGPARTRKRHRTRGPPRTSAPTTAPHGNPADTAHGRVALVATEGGAGPLRAGYGRGALVATEEARVHCAPGTGGSRLSRPRAARVHCAPGTGGSRLSRPRRRGSFARRAREGRACRGRGGAARTRKRHRTHGPPRTSAPTTAPPGNPADTAHGRVALVATEGGAGPLGAGHGRVALVATEGGAGPLRTAVPRTRDRASCTGGRTCTDASRRGSGLNDYPNIDTCILIREVLYCSASSRGRGAVTNKEGQADGQRRADREAGGGRGRRGT